MGKGDECGLMMRLVGCNRLQVYRSAPRGSLPEELRGTATVPAQDRGFVWDFDELQYRLVALSWLLWSLEVEPDAQFIAPNCWNAIDSGGAVRLGAHGD